MHCDSLTSFSYDINIYAGREPNPGEGALGETVVKRKNSGSTREIYDFGLRQTFTSVHFMCMLNSVAVI
jgi:hypothetical protein